VRDHQRPAFHEALGVDPEWYGQEVFRKTTAISLQIFPLALDLDHPRWLPALRRLDQANRHIAEAKKGKGLLAKIKHLNASMAAGWAFLQLLTIPAIKNDVPEETRLEPAY